MFDENQYLNKVKIDNLKTKQKRKIINELHLRFKKHLKKTNLKNWEKVTKRYFTIAGRLKTKRLLKYCHCLFIEYPGLRPKILNYFFDLGFSSSTSQLILELIKEINRYDDVTLFKFTHLVTKINVPRNKSGQTFIREINKILSKFDSDFDLYCYLWFSAKYMPANKILALIQKTKKRWKK